MPQASGTDLRVTATFEEALARASEGARIWMEHWRSLASAGTLPRRSHLDPSAVVRILKNMSITEREDPDTLWLRLVAPLSYWLCRRPAGWHEIRCRGWRAACGLPSHSLGSSQAGWPGQSA